MEALGLGDLPAVDFTSFRSELEHVVDEDLVRELDGVYSEAVREMRKFAEESHLDAEGLVQWLARRFGLASIAEQVAALRGAQAGAWLAGYHVKADVTPFLEASAGMVESAELSQQQIDGILRHKDPLVGALSAVLVETRARREDVMAMTVADLDALGDRTRFRIGGRWMTPPGWGKECLRAYAFWRLAGGAGPDEPLWCSSHFAPFTNASYRQFLGKLHQASGYPFTSFYSNRSGLPVRSSVGVSNLVED